MSKEKQIKTITEKLPKLSEEVLSKLESDIQAFLKEDEEADAQKQKAHRRALFDESVKEDKELLKRLAK